MKVVALADSDSYAKWAAALLSKMPIDWTVQLVLIRTAKEPSADQLAAALEGSGIAASDVPALEFDEAIARAASERPDVVLVATVGPLADLVVEGILGASEHRPVMVSGVPGIALPARLKALVYRSQIDLIVVHSRREVARFVAMADANDLKHDFALATLPFMSADGARGESTGDDVIFAAQAIVPPTRAQRAMLLGWLVSFARAHESTRLVIKVRAMEGEGQTHDETDSYPALLDIVDDVPANLVVEGGPMRARLSRASGLVTVSSTAAIEAIALGVPVIVLDDFGVSPELINDVFIGSGVLGSSRDLLEGCFRSPRAEWLSENYFHDPADNTWLPAIESLVARNREGTLPRRHRVVRGPGGTLRRAWDRKRVLGRYDRSLSGFIALAIGTPARTVLLAIGELRALVRDEPPVVQPVASTHETPARRARSEPTARP